MCDKTGLVGFTPRLRLRFEVRDHVIKTAESVEEVIQALRLRYEIYHGELLGQKVLDGLDLDRFDPICDHMLVVETGTGRVVGTYRLNSSHENDYYAHKDFDISAILRLKGMKLEIGRACIAKCARDGAVFMMLWKGISEYMQQTGVRYVFGGTSMPPGKDLRRVTALFRYLRRKHYSADEFRVFPLNPLPGCVTSERDPSEEEGMNETTISRLLPILSVYLHAGAVVCGEPSHGKDYGTYVFFTLLDTGNLTNAGHKLFRTPDHGAFDNVKAFMRE